MLRVSEYIQAWLSFVVKDVFTEKQDKYTALLMLVIIDWFCDVCVFRCRSQIWWTQRSVLWRPCSSERSTWLGLCRPSVRPRHDPCRSSTINRRTSTCTRTFTRVPSTQVCVSSSTRVQNPHDPALTCVCVCVFQTRLFTRRCQKHIRTRGSTWRTCRRTPDTAASWWMESFTSTPHRTPWTSEYRGQTDWTSSEVAKYS